MKPLVLTFLGLFVASGVPAAVGGFETLRVTLLVLATGLAAALYLAMMIDRQVPRLVLLPAILYLGWGAIAGGFPLGFFWPDVAPRALGGAQIVLGGILLAVYVAGWARPRRNGFSLPNLVGLLALGFVLAPLLATAASLHLLGREIETRSGGYVTVRADGLWLEDREFRRGDQRVRLVGMMHIGSADFYRGVYESFRGDDRRIVLLEGVTDRERLLTGRLSYARLAAAFGLKPQEASELSSPRVNPADGEQTDRTVTFRHADIDVSAFSVPTLAFLNTLGALFASPTLPAALEILRDPDSPLRDPGIEAAVMADILEGRNEHLLGEIEQALDRGYPTVIVPWGALHLPEIETALRASGFQSGETVRRAAVSW